MNGSSASAFHSMGREELLRALEMFAKNWLAHDGCWFLAAEERLGMEAAIELDTRAWERFAAVEAQRIMTTFQVPQQGGLEALETALGFRMYGLINAQRMEWSQDRTRCGFLWMSAGCRKPGGAKGLWISRARAWGWSNSKPLPEPSTRDPHHLPALSSGNDRSKILRLGVQRGGRSGKSSRISRRCGVTSGRAVACRCEMSATAAMAASTSASVLKAPMEKRPRRAHRQSSQLWCTEGRTATGAELRCCNPRPA